MKTPPAHLSCRYATSSSWASANSAGTAPVAAAVNVKQTQKIRQPKRAACRGKKQPIHCSQAKMHFCRIIRNHAPVAHLGVFGPDAKELGCEHTPRRHVVFCAHVSDPGGTGIIGWHWLSERHSTFALRETSLASGASGSGHQFSNGITGWHWLSEREQG